MQYVSICNTLHKYHNWANIRRMERFGDRLRSLRESKGLSQEELAKALGYARENLNAIENNRRSCPERLFPLISEKLESPISTLEAWRLMDEYSPEALVEAVKQLGLK